MTQAEAAERPLLDKTHPIFRDKNHPFRKHLEENVPGYVSPEQNRREHIILISLLIPVIFSFFISGFTDHVSSSLYKYNSIFSTSFFILTGVLIIFVIFFSSLMKSERIELDVVIKDLQMVYFDQFDLGMLDDVKRLGRVTIEGMMALAERIKGTEKRTRPYDPQREALYDTFDRALTIFGKYRILRGNQLDPQQYFMDELG